VGVVTVCRACGVEFEASRAEVFGGLWMTCRACRAAPPPTDEEVEAAISREVRALVTERDAGVEAVEGGARRTEGNR
jgi:hypothetical protein